MSIFLLTLFSSAHHCNGNDQVKMEVKKKKSKPKEYRWFLDWQKWGYLLIQMTMDVFKNICYIPLFFENWNRGYIPIKEFSRCQEIYIIFNFYFNPSILLNICKILRQQGPQFSYVLLRIVFLFWVLYALTPNNNTLCPLLLDCRKQQLIISFSVSLHIVWFLKIDCTLMVPVICLGSQEFSVSFLSPCTAVIPFPDEAVILFQGPFWHRMRRAPLRSQDGDAP